MENNKVSNFTLERNRLGELPPEDRKAMEEAFAMNENVRSRLIILDESDREMRKRNPAEFPDHKGSRLPQTNFLGRCKRVLARVFNFQRN